MYASVSVCKLYVNVFACMFAIIREGAGAMYEYAYTYEY